MSSPVVCVLHWPAILAVSSGVFAAALWLFYFHALLLLLSPGTHRSSRWLFVALLAAGAPVFLKMVFYHSVVLWSRAFVFASFYYGLTARERLRPAALLAFVVCTGLAVVVEPGSIVLLFPFSIGVVAALWQRRRQVLAILTGVVLLSLWGALALPGLHGVSQTVWYDLFSWPFLRISRFQYGFDVLNGWRAFLYPLLHPGFCMLLPGLLLLFKKTDLRLPSKQTLCVCGLCWCAFMAGCSDWNLADIWPAYAILLLLVFPAWDRFFAYGSYFFKNLTLFLLFLALLCQIAGVFWVQL